MLRPELQTSRAAIVMAGGDGRRLRSFTRRFIGHDAPKQFCVLTGTTTLVEQALERAALMVDRGLRLTVVNRAHRHFYSHLMSGLDACDLVEQPGNRDTAPATLYGLLRLAERAPNASVVLLPSDHYIEDERRFAQHVRAAFVAVEDEPEVVVLIGVKPSSAETSYGWITPGTTLSFAGAKEIRSVEHFVEKPRLAQALRLMERGGLWNTSVIVGRVSTLLGMFMAAAPELYFAFARIRQTFDTVSENDAVEALYCNLRPANFSCQILERSAPNLAVLAVDGVHWSDLGEAARVMDAMARAVKCP